MTQHGSCSAGFLAISLSLQMLMAGCAAKRAPLAAPPANVGAVGPARVAERLVTRRASITVRVPLVSAAARRVEGSAAGPGSASCRAQPGSC